MGVVNLKAKLLGCKKHWNKETSANPWQETAIIHCLFIFTTIRLDYVKALAYIKQTFPNIAAPSR